MPIGVLSDSHGRWEITGRAVSLLQARGASLLLHLGDVCDVRVIDELVGTNARIVFGNCDDEIAVMTRYAQHLGIAVDDPIGSIMVDGRRIAYTHGHMISLLDQAINAGTDYLLHGHTHEPRDERIGQTRVINPGALFRARRYTVALLDPATDRLEFIEVPPAP